MTMGDCYRLAVSERLSHEQAVIAAAIAQAESGCDSDAVGDESLQDGTWGPSIGLWQIRSLKAEPPGGIRDAGQLKSPVFNAHSMAVISDHGRNFAPWSTYKSGAYLPHVAAARAQAGKGAPAHAPMPSGGAQTVPTGLGGGDWNPLPGDSGIPGYGDDLLGWASGKVKDELFDKALTGIVYSAAFGLAVTLIAIGAWRAVSGSSS